MPSLRKVDSIPDLPEHKEGTWESIAVQMREAPGQWFLIEDYEKTSRGRAKYAADMLMEKAPDITAEVRPHREEHLVPDEQGMKVVYGDMVPGVWSAYASFQSPTEPSTK